MGLVVGMFVVFQRRRLVVFVDEESVGVGFVVRSTDGRDWVKENCGLFGGR